MVSSVRSMLKTPDSAGSPAVRWPHVGRISAAGALMLGAGFELASNSIEPTTESTLDRLTWIAAHPGAANLANVFALLAVPFFLGTVLVYVLLSRQRSPSLAYAAGIALGVSMVGLAAVEGSEALLFTLAQKGGHFDAAQLADVIDQASSPPTITVFLLFIPFAFFGQLMSAVALWRSRAIPRAAVLLNIPAFIVIDFFLNEGFGIAPDFAGPAVSFAGACWIGAAILMAGRPVGRRQGTAGGAT